MTINDIPVDGKTRVAYVPTIASISAPTTTELNAGILLQSVITADGLIGYEPDTADVDTSGLDSTFDTKTIGRDSFSNTMLRLKRQSGTDTAYNTLTRGTTGYIVIRRNVTSTTAWASTQRVGVYPIICGQTRELSPEANSVSRYEVATKITDTPEIRANVA